MRARPGLVVLALLAPSVALAEDPAGLSLTLREAAARALENGPGVFQAIDTVHYWHAEVEAQRAPFIPLLKLDTGVRATSDPAISPYYDYFSPPDIIRGVSGQATVSLAARLAVGTEFEAKVGWNQSLTDQRGTPLSPEYRLPIELSVSQPLLRGLGSVNRKDLQLAIVRRDQSGDEYRRNVQDIVLSAAEAYVGLQGAQARIQSRKISRDLAVSVSQATAELISLGRLPPTARAAPLVVVSLREQDLRQGEVELARARASLAFSLGLPPNQQITAADPLAPEPLPLASEAVGELAQEKNPEVLANAREVEVAKIAVNTQRNQALPDLRLRAAAGTFGQSGTSRCSNGYYLDGVSPCQVPAQLNGGPGLAVANAFTGKFGYLSAGVVFSIPLDRTPVVKALQAAEQTLARTEHALEVTRQRVRLRAEQSAIAIKALAEVLSEAHRSVELATQALETARDAQRLGKGTVFDLLKSEELVAQARDREVSVASALALENVRLKASVGGLASSLLGSDPAPPLAEP